ncbi:MAG TPA: hypothetical protein IAA98_12895 [Candidatus Avipropionibacterium avicola]|uniref:Uncharacterized protein n=1 Tax=Candidatus Avipropionibacterium avicola TaxID=2840701 RepID=A0A9D1H138_9ACTN|nr:hypothetical protein [Candidatus Avipropionibacterium avicola]
MTTLRHERLEDPPATGPVAPTVVATGASLGGPRALSGAVLERLVAAECAGAHLVLVAAHPEDLDTPVAQVVRQVVTWDPALAREATARYGAERVTLLATAEAVEPWLDRLRRPESMTLRRRLRRRLRRVAVLTRLHDLLTRGRR